MTSALTDRPPRDLARRVALTSIGLFVLVASLTVLFLCSRAVMEIGGSCATGGPYVVARPCPQGVGWMVPLSIFAGLGGLVVYVAGETGLPGPSWAVLAWPALFLSLGWNFWEFGLRSGQAGSVGFLVCGVLFVLMGAAPLVAVLRSPTARHDLLWADAERDPPTRPSRGDVVRRASPPPRRPAATSAVPTAPLLDDLERLAALHRDGSLTDDEFAAAKAILLGSGVRA